MSTVDVFNRNLRTLTAFGKITNPDKIAVAEWLRYQVGAGIYTSIAINDALSDLMRQGYVEASGDGYKRINSVDSYQREHSPDSKR